MSTNTNMTTSKHLSPEQRAELRRLFTVADHAELLRCVAGLVAHDGEDLHAATEAASLILRASSIVAGHIKV